MAVSDPALVQVQFNNLLSRNVGVDNVGAGMVDASWNWWGCPNGPQHGGACATTGGGNIVSSPWLPLPATVQQSY